MKTPHLNETHDPSRRSWVESANPDGSDFPIQNLPFGVFRSSPDEAFRVGIALGDQIIDMHAIAAMSPFDGLAQEALALAQSSALNPLMAAGSKACSALRLMISRAFCSECARWGFDPKRLSEALRPMKGAELSLPARIGDYTDFYTSIDHATNIGKLFRPDNPLLPNYRWIPIGYHGRASSVIISGQDFHRPCGQTMPPGAERPVFGPSKRLDIELELGIFVGQGNELGQPIGIDNAESHIFGLCLLNDWSARDIQAWEYQPLGPFLSKNFATSISPWVVTLEALGPFRLPFGRPAGDPAPLPYLDGESNQLRGSISIDLVVELATQRMASMNLPPSVIARSNYRHAYWTAAQLVTHHTANGCNLAAGDLLGTGTLSGPTADSAGALIELTQGGNQALMLPSGESRIFLEDGDTISLKASCSREGFRSIGFGDCTATVLPAKA